MKTMKRILIYAFLIFISISNLSSKEFLKLFNEFNNSKELSIDVDNLYLPYKDISSVKFNSKLLDENNYDIGDYIGIELTDGNLYMAKIDRINRNVNGTLSVRARFKDHEMGYMILSETKGHVVATVRIPEKREMYSIQSNKEKGFAYLKTIDVPNMDILETEVLIPDKAPKFDKERLEKIKEAAKKSKTGNIAEINVMIVYTQRAKNWSNNNQGSIENTVAQSMEIAQLVLDNSDTRINMNLVNSSLVDYTESTQGGSTDLARLTDPTDGYMTRVHEWRETYGADLVALFASVSDVGGVAWLLTYRRGLPDMGFSLTRIEQAGTSYTHIHEMGHNMGAHHHAQQNFQPGPTQWNDWSANRWSAGWRWLGNDDEMYVTVMSYNHGSYYDDGINAERAPYFSNPNIIYKGQPTGITMDANNARTLREIRHVIASYMSIGDGEMPKTSFFVKDQEGRAVENAKISIEHSSKKDNNNKDDDGQWIQWDNGHNAYQVGTGGQAEFKIASRWEPSDLTNMQGKVVDRISFFPTYENASYTLKVWRGSNPSLIYSQEVEEYTPGQWNEFELDVKPFVDTSEELWFGVGVETQGGYPVGTDFGPVRSGKGNMMYYNNQWIEIKDFDDSRNYNWNLKAYLTMPSEIVVYTDFHGKASVYTMRGDYNVIVEKDNYETKEKHYTIDNKNVGLNITLFDETISDVCEVEFASEITIFPNPANDIVFVRSDSDELKEIRLINLSGQVIKNKKVNNFETKLDVRDIPNGLYIIQINTEQTVFSERIVVSN